MKKILLSAGSRAGMLRVLPLCRALRKSGRYDAQLAAPSTTAASLTEVSGLMGLAEGVTVIATSGVSPVSLAAEAVDELGKLMVHSGPDLVLVGDDSSFCLAAAVAAASMELPIGSLDAGLRHGRSDAPGEARRKMIDAAADIMFTSEHSGLYNLVNEGAMEEEIFFVGNLAIDSLAAVIPASLSSDILDRCGVEEKKYVVLLCGNARGAASLSVIEKVAHIGNAVAGDLPILLFNDGGSEALPGDVAPELPAGLQAGFLPAYPDLLRLLRDARCIVTDSELGQDVATVMKVPCITMEVTTLRPATVEIGTNVLSGSDVDAAVAQLGRVLGGEDATKSMIPEKWDGAVAGRVIDVLDRLAGFSTLALQTEGD
ncbi:UDP-N-acetylglucosamine 2-epimerase [Prosthecochloris vibrioformis]|uniref:UDP-N-acetyl glucosamine 2-epimerase n=1 Tax=Prosthecochloris vibrioformis TaxID=1098 RepID=A0A5C4S0A1_PROVB|nr:UDP-N-acetylglucosamine 2-epimerase [Prosthecochloris vibrioformis]TNJ36457.1 UDP-N-acetyl glucosamine 2-epimerase [Prosthecochloris vibrioformis]